MKQIRNLLLLCFSVSLFNLHAYQQSFLNLISPTELSNFEGEFAVAHRFKGKLEAHPLTNAFGLNDGAWVGLAFRQAFIEKLEIRPFYTMMVREVGLDGSWRFTGDDFPVQLQADLQYYGYDDYYHPGTRAKSAMGILVGRYDLLGDRIILDANLGYEGHNKRFVSGYGLGFSILPSLTLLGEYYPVFDRNSAPQSVKLQIGKYDCMSLGLKYDTLGHHFMLLLTNTQSITLRQLTLGTPTKDLKLGFNIQRHLPY